MGLGGFIEVSGLIRSFQMINKGGDRKRMYSWGQVMIHIVRIGKLLMYAYISYITCEISK